ncbi:MAG: orotidine-5'-phosphate decarboxylase [Chitinophagales bacterium]|nr:orotidine-5'-phosphate decarboxylase [Chitinophagales bacterium]MDW8428263.1 orotidine-5'-phosphate decarboxylase [Chitinophagales bacterium]
MNRTQLLELIRRKKSFLCVGLDPDYNQFPQSLPHTLDGIRQFLSDIIEVTVPHAVAYKLNTAFFEALGPDGWSFFWQITELLPPDVLVIADAKRGDIGSSAAKYAEAFFLRNGKPSRIDALTVFPYMGQDSVSPFLQYEGKWVALLALTSNSGAEDFQLKHLSRGTMLFEEVVLTSQQWGNIDNLMYVVGATRPELLRRVRALAPQHVLLVPGIGHQGGSLAAVAEAALTASGPVLAAVSRSILYASSDNTYKDAAAAAVQNLQEYMKFVLNKTEGTDS